MNSSETLPMSAADLVARIQASDRIAEKQLVSQYQRGLMLVLRRQSNHDIAQDVAQETWRIVLEKIRNGDVREPERLAAFIVQTGRNQIIMHYRRNKKADVDIAEIEEPIDPTDPCELLERSQAQELTQKLLDGLTTSRDRELIQRFYLLEQDKEDICKALDLSELHFNRVIFRAKQRLKVVAESLGIFRD